jgi:hypothetical protein
MFLTKLLFSICKLVGTLLLAGVILWQVVEQCGPNQGKVIVHVSKAPVHVRIDEATYPVGSIWMSPIVCELSPGRHTLRMLHEGRVLYEEPFTLKAGEEIILVAWDGYNDGRSPPQADCEDVNRVQGHATQTRVKLLPGLSGTDPDPPLKTKRTRLQMQFKPERARPYGFDALPRRAK